MDKTIFHEGEQIAPAHADALPADLGPREPARHAGEPARLAGADPERGPDLLEREVVLELGLRLAEQHGQELLLDAIEAGALGTDGVQEGGHPFGEDAGGDPGIAQELRERG